MDSLKEHHPVNHDLNVTKLIDCCKIPLRPHWDPNPIGDALCVRTLIGYLSELYKDDDKYGFDPSICDPKNKLAPNNLFDKIRANLIISKVNLNNREALSNLKIMIRQFAHKGNLLDLNEKLIDAIHNDYKNWDTYDERKKFETYHMFIL